MHSSQIYRIRDRRAVPIALPDAKTHPKDKVLEGQIGFACLEDSAQGGPQIPSERNLLASLNLLEIG